MRFGAHYLPTYIASLDGPVAAFYQHIFEQAELMDTLGVHDLWVTEHHFHEYGGTISNPPTFLAAVARTTRRIHLGVAVSVLPLHNPVQIAEAYAMVDNISNGRLEFGIGRGSTPPEFAGFGVSQADSALRMREAAEIIRQAWTDETVNFHGELFSYSDIRVLPRPVQQPHPTIWVGASRSDDTFRWAGEKGYNLMTLPYMYEPPVLQHWVGVYKDALCAAGHDLAAHEILGKFHIYVAPSDREAHEQAAKYFGNYETLTRERNTLVRQPNGVARDRHDIDNEIETGNVIAGDSARVIEIIHRWKETIGLTTMSGTFHFGGMPQELALRNIRLFAERVMPEFPREAAATASSASGRG
ncbi:MAG TPA: LLM class flavin-dependent oxidoreductase [Chloroflexota bacterium]|nr:LLM class flavin-dependent oxidoreductase [Chloroflexota bacterium]